MADDLTITEGSKAEQYKTLLPQIFALIEDETDFIANLANIAGALKEQFNWWWVGFYLVKEDTLVLGPFQGPVACTRISMGRGVCGSSWKEKRVLIVPDVDAFPGHISCNSASKSEIVLPIIKNDTVMGVLDVDSEHLNHFDETDQKYLLQLLSKLVWNP